MTLSAERIKLTTTRSPLWSAIGVVVLSLLFAVIQAAAANYSEQPLTPQRAALGVSMFGVPVLMIVAALTVTGEYRTGLIRTTFMATPNRTRVLLEKAFVSAVFAGALTVVTVLAAIVVARMRTGGVTGAELTLTQSAAWRPVAMIGLYAVLGAVLAVGLAAVLRNSAGVTALLLMTPFVIEPLLGSTPNVGEHVGPLLPFANAFTFAEVPFVGIYQMWWGPTGALLYFTAVVAAVFLAGVVAVNRRDP